MTKKDNVVKVEGDDGKISTAEVEPADITHCPTCGAALQKFLIQQNYAIVMCPKEDCGYPFNQEKNIDNIAYVDEKDVLEVAQQRLSVQPKKG